MTVAWAIGLLGYWPLSQKLLASVQGLKVGDEMFIPPGSVFGVTQVAIYVKQLWIAYVSGKYGC
jgi:hypothetical protein